MGWTNYGDIKPLEYGGKWFKKDGERSYRVVEIVSHIEKNDTWIIYDMYIDLNDSCINNDEIKEYAGTEGEEIDDVNHALDCISYYGGENFDAQPYEVEGRENIIADLKNYGIEI